MLYPASIANSSGQLDKDDELLKPVNLTGSTQSLVEIESPSIEQNIGDLIDQEKLSNLVEKNFDINEDELNEGYGDGADLAMAFYVISNLFNSPASIKEQLSQLIELKIRTPFNKGNTKLSEGFNLRDFKNAWLCRLLTPDYYSDAADVGLWDRARDFVQTAYTKSNSIDLLKHDANQNLLFEVGLLFRPVFVHNEFPERPRDELLKYIAELRQQGNIRGYYHYLKNYRAIYPNDYDISLVNPEDFQDVRHMFESHLDNDACVFLADYLLCASDTWMVTPFGIDLKFGGKYAEDGNFRIRQNTNVNTSAQTIPESVRF